jgi:predicted SnoaL-like aldol condensation-catalyzing enzyme
VALPGVQHLHGCVVASSKHRSAPLPERQSREVFERFVDLMFRRGHVRAAFESCVLQEGYIDHAGFRSRSAAMTRLAPEFGLVGPKVSVVHSAFEGEIGMVHLAVEQGAGLPPGSRVEIFRVADGRIAEHWSVAA